MSKRTLEDLLAGTGELDPSQIEDAADILRTLARDFQNINTAMPIPAGGGKITTLADLGQRAFALLYGVRHD